MPELGETGFYSELPKILKMKFIQHKFGEEIQQIHILRNAPIEFASQLIIYYKPQHSFRGDIIYDIGDYAEEMCFLMNGNVRMLCQSGIIDVIMGNGKLLESIFNFILNTPDLY